jgi:hypothetical protein
MHIPKEALDPGKVGPGAGGRGGGEPLHSSGCDAECFGGLWERE